MNDDNTLGSTANPDSLNGTHGSSPIENQSIEGCRLVEDEYPALDDIKSWMSLADIFVNATDGSKPHIPDPVMAFRISVFSDLIATKRRLGLNSFHRIYGSTDIFEVARDQWFLTIGDILNEHGESIFRKLFRVKMKPMSLKSHVHPGVRKLIELYSAENAEPIVRFPKIDDSHTFVEISAQTPDSTIDKTFVETHDNPVQERVTQNPQPPSGIDGLEQVLNVQLPLESESVPMGSGTSCGIIGEGGMAQVYLVRNSQLEVFRAGKVLLLHKLSKNKAEAKTYRNRYEMEAKISAQLHHTNIVPIYQYSKFRGLPYLEMEYVDGMDLKRLVAQKGALPAELATTISILCARGLSYAHRQNYTLYGKQYSGIMHRDIKPANILVSMKKADVKLTDFGIARPPEVSLHTVGNNLVGTLGYMSPEQLESTDLDARTDIYSFGATMYEMLSGIPLFGQDNFMDLMKARQANAYKQLSSVRADIPRSLTQLVDSCLKINARHRIQSAETLVDQLEQAHFKLTKEKPESVLQDYIEGKQFLKPSAERREKQTFFGRFFGK